MTKDDFEELLFQIECDLTTLAFVVLKLTHVIEWAWFWVLFPVWASIITKLIMMKSKGSKK